MVISNERRLALYYGRAPPCLAASGHFVYSRTTYIGGVILYDDMAKQQWRTYKPEIGHLLQLLGIEAKKGR